MLRYFLDVRDDSVSLFIQVLLAKAKDEIEPKEAFHEVVDHGEVDALGDAEGRVEGVAENIVARYQEHSQVKNSFPGRVFLDH